MAGSGPTQGRVRRESLGDTIRRRAREAEAAAYEGIRQAIRAGRELELKTPGEVLSYGARLLQEKEARAARTVSKVVHATKRDVGGRLDRLGRNPEVKRVAGDVARPVGNAAGVVRGGVHAVQGLAGGGAFVGRLLNPLDALTSPPGETAPEQLDRASADVARATIGYVRRAAEDPGVVVRDVRRRARQWREELDPSATPVAPTFSGELRRNFDIGQNQGELVFDVGSLWIGGPAAKAVKGLGRVSNVGNVEKYAALGFSPKAAAYLSKPYPVTGMGSHFIPRRARLPEGFGGGPLPKSYMDGPFNRLAPAGISRGDLYELHYKVDPRFHVARLPGKVGGGIWHGGTIGLERYGLPGRLWHGSPAPLKARMGGLGAGVGGALYMPQDEEDSW